MLHLIAQNLPQNLLQHCIQLANTQNQPEILLYQDGVYLVLTKLITVSKLSIYALKDDIEVRGLSKKFSDKIILINYKDFVNLTIKHEKIISW